MQYSRGASNCGKGMPDSCCASPDVLVALMTSKQVRPGLGQGDQALISHDQGYVIYINLTLSPTLSLHQDVPECTVRNGIGRIDQA